MNHIKPISFLCAAIVAAVCLTPKTGWAGEPMQQIDTVRYEVYTRELQVENKAHTPIAPKEVQHFPKQKQLSFVIPNSIVQPTPRIVDVQGDPIIKRIVLEQRAINLEPAVKVLLELYTNAPVVPYQFLPSTTGLKMALTPTPPEKALAGTPAQPLTQQMELIPPKTLSQTDPAVTSISSTSSNPSQMELQQGVDRQTLEHPKTPVATFSQQPAEPVQTSTNANPAPDNRTEIGDVFYEDNVLTIVAPHAPLQVKRSFVLSNPSRYVVDLAPAVLPPQALKRVIPQTHPNIADIKAGQFDEQTVRLVVQFANEALPVDLRQDADNRMLQLTFRSF